MGPNKPGTGRQLHGIAPLTPQAVQQPPRLSYSQALSSRQATMASFPPLETIAKKTAQSTAKSPATPTSHKITSDQNRGQQIGARTTKPTGSGRPEPRPFGSNHMPSGNTQRGNRTNLALPFEEQDVRITTMNEDLNERFGRGSALRQNDIEPSPTKPSMVVNQSIRKYVKKLDDLTNLSDWKALPEIPSPEEIFDSGRQHHDEVVEVLENIVLGPYDSKEDYLERHHSLLREDAVAPLRDAVSDVQANPHLMEADTSHGAFIYEKVFITGLTFAFTGVATRITFSLRRVGKKINWEQSKRLLTGAIVALTPANDMFQSQCHIAVIAARPIAGLEQNPPEIDIFFRSPEEVAIDPQQEWLMVESRNGFYEGHRHTLRGLQKLAKESFPLSQHIVDIERDVPPPKYVEDQPKKDLSMIFEAHKPSDMHNVDILNGWPKALPSGLDTSQTSALRRILAKQLAIVQGPPGTGKTHVSVTAIRLLLENMAPNDPPIIVAAHTNHALDQLLRHISKFEPEFIRLGGWTTDMEIIKPRTLYEVKNAVKYSELKGSLRGPARMRIRQLVEEMIILLAPLTEGIRKGPLPADLFLKYGIVTDDQSQSLIDGAKGWIVSGAEEAVEGPSGDVALWLGDEQVEAKQRTLPEDFGIEIEEVDLEFEQLKELEAESRMIDDEDHDTLRGRRIVFSEPFTGFKTLGVTQQTVQKELQKQDLWDIPTDHRGPVYRYMQQKVKEAILAQFQPLVRQYAKLCQDYKIGGWEMDYNYLKQARVVGMTTTGLSKYRALIQALEPKIVIIEEAAETLEAPIAVACFETLEHLILVGDHLQLRAHCNDPQLATKPFYLGVSMFERLIRNKMEFSQLKRQRRMIPEIRRALNPIYKELEDHPSVNNRAPVPGMGGINSYFFSHKNRESADAQMSKTNIEEADMVVCFFNYLVQNGMEANEITVLTFYNGQRKLILRKLREHRHLQQVPYLKVVTVDSYQGEENAVVLLSLVRSNEHANIGFLEVENRICVAISRAQRGFYLFGDAPNLCKSSMLWWLVVQAMGKNPCRVGFYLHLTCQNHNYKTYVKDSYGFRELDGGCAKLCHETMQCGHPCLLRCHPFPHEAVDCKKPCSRSLACGHPCARLCHDTCKSDCECAANEIEEDANIAKVTSVSLRKNEPQLKVSTSQPNPWSRPSLKSVQGRKAPSLGKQYQPLTPFQYQTPTYSQELIKIDDVTDEKTHPSSSAKPPSFPVRNTELETRAFKDYAAGGHIESDKNLASIAEQENAETRRKLLDEENFAALFSEVNVDKGKVLAHKSDGVNLVRTRTNAQGGSRGIWKGTIEIPQKDENNGASKGDTSLLDLF